MVVNFKLQGTPYLMDLEHIQFTWSNLSLFFLIPINSMYGTEVLFEICLG